jgi:CheY-like chemotaxis protein
MDGYEVASRMRQEPAAEGATLVAVTGYGGPDTTKRCREAGFDRHFTKPIRQEMLLELLREE